MAITKLQLTELQSQVTVPIDFFICCASYEDRCLSIANAIALTSINKAIIAVHKDILETEGKIGENFNHLKERFQPNFKSVEVYTSNPLSTANNIVSTLDSLGASNSHHYFIDITTFTHETLLILFRILMQRAGPDHHVTLSYASAKEYCPGLPRHEKWLSYGVSDVRSVLGYPGDILPMKKNHLIVLVGYEHHRASELIEAYEPNIVSLGYGSPSSAIDQKDEGASKYFTKLLRQSIATYCSVNEFSFSCNNPIDAKNSILKQTMQTRDCNHIIAPMNTKISTIGSALATIEDDTIQLCYAHAIRYNSSHYSSPGENCYLMDLPELLATHTISTH